MRELLEDSSLTQLASDVNKAILMAHGQQADMKIAFYWQMLQWAQEQLRRQVLPNGKRLDFPAMYDPLEELDYEEGGRGGGETGAGDADVGGELPSTS